MSKHFRAWNFGARQLLPAAVEDYVDEKHLARFVVALVVEELDLAEVEAAYKSPLGQPPFDPRMMVALLLYGYCKGLFASRRIAQAARERLDVMLIVAGDPPDFRTISDFRKRHHAALRRLYGQVLKLCDMAGLTGLGHVAFDGSKVRANASKHKAMSYARMDERAQALEAEVANWFAAAEKADAADDQAHGPDSSGAAMPPWIASKQQRAAAIRKAKAELEAEAKAAAAAKASEQAEAAADEAKRLAEGGKRKGGRKPAPPSDAPDPKAQKNFTDSDSAIMKTKDGFQQAYNGQAAVCSTFQIIVAQGLDACQSDQHQLLAMVDQIGANLGRLPDQASADAGYFSDSNLRGLEARNIDGYVAPGRAKHATDQVTPAAATAAVPDAGLAPAATAAAASTEAVPTEAASSGTAPTEAAPTEAAPTEAAPTEAAPTEAAPTEGAPTEGAPTEGAVETLVSAAAPAVTESSAPASVTAAERPPAAPAVAAGDAAKPGERIGPPTRTEAMREKLRAGGHQSPYRLRKQLPEPVFGQIKEARGFRRFLLRGLEKVRAEWALVCTTHNIIKLAKGRNLSAAGNN